MFTATSTAAEIQAHTFACQRSPDQDAADPARHPVVIVGAGPVGLSLAIDLAQRGQRVLLLDDDDKLSTGSRAICFAKRTLEVWDRLGVGAAMCARGVEWQRGRVFYQAEPLFHFDLLPEPGHERPAFINLQQFYAEAFLALRAAELPNLEIRWKHKVIGIEQRADQAHLSIETPDGCYVLAAAYVAACDGSRSPVRGLMGLSSSGRVFRDRFLIADVRMQADFPSERWFWFDPPFHPGQSVLLHRQPDDVWRIDFQLGWDADPDEEKKIERIRPRVDALMTAALGHPVPFELAWASVYTFACQRMEKFRHGRVLFAGDAAHGVSPFGARGANSGVQDADNLGWKLAAVLQGQAPDALLDSYAFEREMAADENIRHSTRSTDFITPKSAISRLFRDAVLQLSRRHEFARKLVNSGRLSLPSTLHGSALNTPMLEAVQGAMVPGAAAADAPVQRPDGTPSWLLHELGSGAGSGFCLLVAGDFVLSAPNLCVLRLGHDLLDTQGLIAARYDLQAGGAVLLRPDQHVCARWRKPTAEAVQLAMQRALAKLP